MMIFFKNLSIRNKLGLLLASSITLMLALYAGIVLQNVKEDKLAYVYDSNLALSRTVAEQTYQNLNFLVERINFYFSQFNPAVGFNNTAGKVISSDQFVDGLQIKSLTSGQTWNLIASNRAHEISNEIEAQIANQLKITELAILSDSDGKWYLGLISQQPADKYQMIVRVNHSRFLEIFDSGDLDEMYLVDNKGQIVYRAADSQAQFPLKTVQSLASEITQAVSKQAAGSAQYVSEKSFQGESYLVSLTSIGFKDLKLLSLITKSKALEPIYLILAKSGLLLIFFLLLAVVVSIIAPAHLTQALNRLYLATKEVEKGNLDLQIPSDSEDEIGSLSKSFNHMTREVKRLMIEMAEKLRMENELRTAKAVQETLLPSENYISEKVSILGYYEPASECGGDWWHYHQEGSKIFIWIGDVTGHGAPAAIVTSAVRSATGLIEDKSLPVHEILQTINKAIYVTTKGSLMMTSVVACYDEETHCFAYSCASHEPPLLMPNPSIAGREKIQFLQDNNGLRLGENLDATYRYSEITLNPGDQIVLYTDGVIDLVNPDGKPLGERRWLNGLLKISQNSQSAKERFSEITSLISKHREDAALHDDVTVVLFSRNS